MFMLQISLLLYGPSIIPVVMSFTLFASLLLFPSPGAPKIEKIGAEKASVRIKGAV
jgi:hypothetical protein